MARFRLNPNETASENLWRAVRTATADILRKSSVRIAQEDRDDVFDDISYAGYTEFVQRVVEHSYDRSHSWFQNAYSSTKSHAGHIIDKYVKTANVRLSTASLHAPLADDSDTTMLDVITSDTTLDYDRYGRPRTMHILDAGERAAYGVPDLSPRLAPLEYADAVYAMSEAEGCRICEKDRKAVYDRIRAMMATPSWRKYRSEKLSKIKRSARERRTAEV